MWLMIMLLGSCLSAANQIIYCYMINVMDSSCYVFVHGSFPTLCDLNSLLMINECRRVMLLMEVKFWGLLFKTPITQSRIYCILIYFGFRDCLWMLGFGNTMFNS